MNKETTELKKMSNEQLNQELVVCKTSLSRAVAFNKAGFGRENSMSQASLRKRVARILTILNERERI